MIMDRELLRFSTFNARGLGENSKRCVIMNWLSKYSTGIIFLQETHSVEISEKYWRKDWKGQIEFCHGSSSARGVAILLPSSIDITINEVIRENTGRFLLLDTRFENQSLILINVYAPTKDKTSLQRGFLHFVQLQLKQYVDNGRGF